MTPAVRGAGRKPTYTQFLIDSPVSKDGSEVTETHHATRALLAPATLAVPPCIEVGATAPPGPYPGHTTATALRSAGRVQRSRGHEHGIHHTSLRLPAPPVGAAPISA